MADAESILEAEREKTRETKKSRIEENFVRKVTLRKMKEKEAILFFFLDKKGWKKLRNREVGEKWRSDEMLKGKMEELEDKRRAKRRLMTGEGRKLQNLEIRGKCK